MQVSIVWDHIGALVLNIIIFRTYHFDITYHSLRYLHYSQSCSNPSFSTPSLSSPPISIIVQSCIAHPRFCCSPSFTSPANPSHPWHHKSNETTDKIKTSHTAIFIFIDRIQCRVFYHFSLRMRRNGSICTSGPKYPLL